MSKIDYYGVLEQHQINNDVILQAAEEITTLGYAVIDSGYSPDKLEKISHCFNLSHASYVEKYGISFLQNIDEFNGVRLPMAFDKVFLDLALNPIIIKLVQSLIKGKFYLNQQNAIINPPGQHYNQSAFHRDLPYQHFVSSRPLAINCLFCVDDFTELNGSTIVIPCSHKSEKFPSDNFIKNHSIKVTAPVGSFIVLDCMVFHKGGFNSSDNPRRAVNHVYTIPFFKQQINIPNVIGNSFDINDEQRDILGYKYQVPTGIEEFLIGRNK
ncbi:phytanoyl-CoA dioxygenase family protein [Anabaena aphanizomenioides LEGE 00250]|uniref:Phytanoyl-CoA dioxygenase family protein n=1 Tax=Sphaerospermopsis aphanizomenoides LEGE 00250 TaxID=2777972 RepID=A0ABR9VI90_9CYAN|nr:phytanoyl-CoA dioxygenase family protein [Sphaerospermopsis aphanizomenoides]MBE9238211.1 phytanoyl-CoA dioxygenase family protein [Sphaerospermopsis aphanizomenoides LEGE 00250]